MERDLNQMARTSYDVVIVGGGIFGAAAAWEATSRGLKTALLERGDFAEATSNNHFRMIHGGIRYIQHGDVVRVRESARERAALLRIAPHLVYPLPIAIPTYGHGMKGQEILRAGIMLYDLLTLDRNRGIPDPQRRVPPGRVISRRETLQMFPHLDQNGLTGAALFHDGQVYNPARLALAFLKSAQAAGADIANYAEVQGFITKDGAVQGVRACDTLTGEPFEVRARLVLNAAGPWASGLLGRDANLRLKTSPTFSRDACFVVNRRLLEPSSNDHALTVLGKMKDPDALLSRGSRHLFLVPWQGNTLVGVWHVVYKGDPDRFTVTEADLAGFIDEINEAYPALNLELKDVARWMAGLTLFGENENGQENLSYGKRSQIIDHQVEHRVDGLVTMIGVRYTMARDVAEKAVSLVMKKLRGSGRASRTTEMPLQGGGFESFDSLLKEAERAAGPAFDRQALEALVHNHGEDYPQVLAVAVEDPACARVFPGSQVSALEVVFAARHEMARKLSDVVFRRTDLGSGGSPGEAVLQDAAGLMARELGWDQARTERELEEVRRAFPVFGGTA